MTDADYEWYLRTDLSKYSGKWVAIQNRAVVAVDSNAGKVIDKFKKLYPKKEPIITKINTRLSIL